MPVRPRMTDAERRTRLVARQLTPREVSVPQVVRSLVALHSSDPITPYLAVRARQAGFTIDDLETALYDDRVLWRLHAMRRTLFVVPADEAAVFLDGASRAVARKERRRVEKWLAEEMDAGRVAGWLRQVEAKILETLAGDDELLTQELSAVVPELATEVTLGSGKWATRAPLSSRLLFLLAMEGRVVRARPPGTWRSSQYRWALPRSWFHDSLDHPLAELEPSQARAALARRYLDAYGPALESDVKWWTGWTVRQTRQALREAAATEIELEVGTGYVAPGDLDASPANEARVTLLPGLDPTAMGWQERAWYLGEHKDAVFDRNGNAGPTVWVDGRIVGGWAQRDDGEVVYRLLEDVGAQAAGVVAQEAAALTAWSDGVVARPRFRTPLERELTG